MTTTAGSIAIALRRLTPKHAIASSTVLLGFVALGPACARSDTMIHASDYDQHCAIDRDCTTAFSGDVCAASCICDNDAVNALAWPNYENDLQNLERKICKPKPSCGCPVIEKAYCSQGKCAACAGDNCVPDGG
jgi:hypothetical protein